MKGLSDVYLQQLKTSLAAMLQYRASLVIWLIGNILEPLIYLVVWSTVTRSSGGSVGGFAEKDFAAYYIALLLVNQVTYTWVMYEFDYRVRQGSFSSALLHPIHPIHSDIADNISSKVVSFPFVLAAAAALSAIFHPAFRTTAVTVVFFIPALALAFLVRFLVEWTAALAAFWTTRVNAINQIYFIAALFLSGQIAPLSLLPPPLRTVAMILPFRWTIGFPIELILGRLTRAQILTGLAVQVVWLLAGLALLRIFWRASVRKYSAVGA